jgi:dTDP-4-amino-4,6-dideoxygalactose transaminase
MNVPLLDLERLHRALTDELGEACSRVIASGRYILGENVSALEAEVAAYCDVPYAVGVASGTDALYLSLRALDIKPGDEVITTPFTFVATVDVIIQAGGRPVFVDIEPETFNIDPALVEAAVTARTRAIIPVHLYGQAADMKAIMAIAKNHHVPVIEDNAQALGAVCGGSKTGSIGDTAALSFFPSKNLGCLGDGGMVLTRDEEFAARVRQLRAHGSARKYFFTEIGINSRLDELQAALLRVKLPYLDQWNEARRRYAGLYSTLLDGVPGLKLPVEAPGNYHVYHQFTLRLQQREAVIESLKAAGIGCAVYYPEPLHLQPAFANLGYGAGFFPTAETACREVLSLPIGPELEEQEIRYVATAIKEASAVSATGPLA